jgi:hypothetical protein
MTKHLDRLMSRASVAAMAAFAPKPDPASTIPNFAERVDGDAGGGDGADAIDGLTAEEQAQFAAMNGGKPAGDEGNVDPAGDAAAGEGGVDDDELEAGADDPGTGGDPAPGAGDRDASAPDGAEKRPPPKTVSYGKYQRELAKAQKAADDLQARLDGATKETAKEREERIRLDTRTKMLLEAINTKQPDAAAASAVEDKDPEPDKESDPIGHLEWNNRKLTKVVEDLRAGRQQEQQLSAAETEERQVYGTFSADLEREAAADPTFADAFVHLRETRYRELGFIYADIDITDTAQVATLTGAEQAALSDNIKRAFYNEQVMVARGAMKAGKSPAKVVANLARARGFVPKAAASADAAAAAAAAPNGAAKPANGAAPPARAQAAPQGTVSDQLEQIRQNAAASRSLSDAGGSPGGDLTPERLVAMDDDEFEQLVATMPKGRLDKLMGKGPSQ